QLFEPDGRRIEIYRTSIDDFFECRAQLSEIPADYALARGVHLSWSPLEETAAMIDWLRSHNPQVRLVSEPALSALDLPLRDHLPVLTQLDLLSPDREEARALTGAETITGMFEVLLTNGVPMVALRMGALGSIIGTAAGEFYQVPAVPPAELVDVTGAGNAYCGGFTVGIGRGEETALAAARAAASASFALEQIGVPSFDETKIAEARRRLSWALERIRSAQSLASLLPPGLH
ncbi:MAG TPA: carbohydrate kinase family protein, partial [Roseiflexaceae bacterium]|nr:carbohydrate kinase family protein [Roseiflexaceae bacterium]